MMAATQLPRLGLLLRLLQALCLPAACASRPQPQPLSLRDHAGASSSPSQAGFVPVSDHSARQIRRR